MSQAKATTQARDAAVAYLKRTVDGEIYDHQQRFSAAMTILHSTCGCPCHQEGYDEPPEPEEEGAAN